MPQFKTNVPVAQETADVKVDVTEAEPLPLGPNRFSLVVIDDSGNESEPFFLNVIVLDSEKPTAVLNMVNADGVVIAPEVAFGASFILSASESRDKAPGVIKEFRFTLLDRV